MYDDGYKNIDNMDISEVCIKQMEERNCTTRPEMDWKVMDCRNCEYPDNTYDLIIDKSTIDAMLCSNNAFFNVAIMLKECQRVLKTGGYYVAISYGLPSNREFHFQRQHLSFNMKTFELKRICKDGGISLHYIYICQKQANSKTKLQANYDMVM